jgi:ABC-type transporter Mla subunit MlaD
MVSAVLDAGRSQARLAVELPGTSLAVLRAVRTIAEGAQDARDAMSRVNRVTARLEGLLDEVEPPLRAAGPGLTTAAKLLSDPAVARIPDTLRSLRETQERVAAIASSTERITSFVDDAGSRIGSLPGLFMRRPFRSADPPAVEVSPAGGGAPHELPRAAGHPPAASRRPPIVLPAPPAPAAVPPETPRSAPPVRPPDRGSA